AVESFRVNGLEGATAAASVSTKAGGRDARLVAIRVDTRTIYRFIFITPRAVTGKYSEPFSPTTYSIRRLTEAAAKQPDTLRSRIVTVRPGDTVASLASRMPPAEFREERFRVLNGMGENDRLTAGQKVKIVTE